MVAARFAVALSALGAGLYLAAHHPICPPAAVAVFVCWVVVAVRWRDAWLPTLPAALPVLDFSSWTGWIVFSEFDLLVLGAIAGGWAHLARGDVRAEGTHGEPFVAAGEQSVTDKPAQPLASWALSAFAASTALGLIRGFASGGEWAIGWFDSYPDPSNALRVGKSFLFAVALWPLMRSATERSAKRAASLLGIGICIGLSLFGAAVVWERAAIPGLFDFSTDYRTVALFWEMHVGGAAIDAYAVMAAPFSAWALARARSRFAWILVAALTLITGYAVLTTFARGAYLGVAGALAVLGTWWILGRLRHRSARVRRTAAFVLVTVLALAALIGGLLLAGPAGILFVLLVLWVGLVGVRVAMPAISWRRAAALGLGFALCAEAVAVVGGGTFMRERLEASEPDMSARLAHWERGIGLLDGAADWLFGIGLGRLPDRYASLGPHSEFSGSVSLGTLGHGREIVRVAAAPTARDLGRLYFLSQRVSLVSAGPYKTNLLLRVTADTLVSVDVCEQHLLYVRRCQGMLVQVASRGGSWQRLAATLEGDALGRGDWFAPRLGILSVSVLPSGASAEIAEVSLTAADGTELLSNRDFSAGLARWFPLAQSYFLPWHIDNLYLELLIERGVVGLIGFVVLLSCAFQVLIRQGADFRGLAPYAAAALCGLLILGCLSSLMDSPRVALLLWLIILHALSSERRGLANT